MEEEKKLTRAFICIELSDECVKEIARIDELLSKIKFTGKLTELENLHLTLKFLGEIGDEKIGEIKKRLAKIETPAFEAKLGRIGIFHRNKEPKIVWVKIESRILMELQKKVDDALSDLFPKEERFMSHLTIARIKYIKDKKSFDEKIGNISVEPVKFSVINFKLKSSELRATGPVYRDIEAFSLKAP